MATSISRSRGRISRRAVVVLGVVLIIAATFVLLGMRGKPAETITADYAPIKQTLVFSARVASIARSEIASTTTGRVEKILVREGDRVSTGQLLLTLDDAEIAAQLKQADAALATAEARLRAQREVAGPVANEGLRAATSNYEFAKREFERNQSLFNRGFIGQARLQEADRALANARSALDQARAQQAGNTSSGAETFAAVARVREAQAARELAAAKLAQTRIASPGNARVIGRSVEPGETAQPGRRLLTLALDGETRLIAQIDEKNLSLMREQQVATASADAFPNQKFTAKLTYLAPAVDATRGTVEARLRVDAPPAFLRDDMTVSVEVIAAEKAKALVIPVSAIRDTAKGVEVLVAEGGHAVAKPVRIGIRSAQAVEVLDGLGQGASVIVDAKISAGQRVHAITPTPKAPRSDFEPPAPPGR